MIGRGSEKVQIDVDALRSYMLDYCGTAMFAGWSAAIADVAEIESLGAYELCQKAEELGVDLRKFEA